MSLTRPTLLVALFAIAPLPGAIQADVLNDAISTSKSSNQAEVRTQQRIDQLDDETRAMLAEYQRLSRELEYLVAYDDQLERMVGSQEQEMLSIGEQMQQLELTQREVLPLMLRMLGWLEGLLPADRPFLPEERHERTAQLRALMDRADVSVGEKYRRVLEAYLVEMEYGRTIEAYRGELANGEETRTVDFLRVGRLGLYYQTLDRQEVGHWDAASGSWKILPSEYRLAIRDGLRMARDQAAPDLLRLPVSAPVSPSPAVRAERAGGDS